MSKLTNIWRFLDLICPAENFTLTCVINFFSKWRRRLTEGDDDGKSY
jgi:hypothetical protein